MCHVYFCLHLFEGIVQLKIVTIYTNPYDKGTRHATSREHILPRISEQSKVQREYNPHLVILGNLEILGRTCPRQVTHLVTLPYDLLSSVKNTKI